MSKKQGLHGWRAFLVVVGAGAFAGLASVWAISSFASFFFSSLFSQGQGPEEGQWGGGASSVGGRREHPETLGPAGIDQCELVQDGAEKPFTLLYRLDEDSGPEEISGESGLERVSDECSWDAVAPRAGEVEFSLSYETILSVDAGLDKSVVVEENFLERRGEVGDSFERVDKSGRIEIPDGDSYYWYGTVEGGGLKYSMVRRVGNSIYEIELFASSGSPTLEQFQADVKLMARVLDDPFIRVVPE